MYPKKWQKLFTKHLDFMWWTNWEIDTCKNPTTHKKKGTQASFTAFALSHIFKELKPWGGGLCLC